MATENNEIANSAEVLYKEVVDKQTKELDEQGLRSKIFHQEELLEIAGVKNNKELMQLIQYLTNKHLFRTLKVQGRLGWSARPESAARKIVTLPRDEKFVYEIIEESHTAGIWLKDIKRKAKEIAQTTVQKAVKKMETMNLIKSIKSIKAPAQKTYILFHLVPSEDVTGNSFFDAGDLDESFRDEILNLIILHCRQRGWVENKIKKKSKEAVVVADDDEEGAVGKKRKRTLDIEDAGGRVKHRSAKFDPETDFTQLIYKAGSHNYATAEDVHEFIVRSGAIKPTKANSLTVPEIQGCIDVLVWDDKLERVRNADGMTWGYRTVRGVTFRPPGAELYDEFEEFPGTGFTQAPCGRCPVFDLCRADGPVNPQECSYFEQWLKA